ncbi:hypothetical protein [Flavobacterium pectinovorum]|jgi:hypothetical protein|uniref:Uncharacterized protein n=1 Tax=Flavobacterium pectinovorum TaxID=29533 RepID=A0A502ESV4_9FLAO|nr:hypothetical protein [Flavobacterium pectinovorum]TPG40903.1 hypothetical protein EAH81_11220 [Flavobacterium pectinovorum]
MEKLHNQDYRDYSDLDTLIENEKNYSDTIFNAEDQNHEELINDVNHETNDFNRNENNPHQEGIINGEDQITNDEDPENLDDTLEKDGDLDDDDSDDDNDSDDDLEDVSHDPFPSLDPGNF